MRVELGANPSGTSATVAERFSKTVSTDSAQTITATKTLQAGGTTSALEIKARPTASGGQSEPLVKITDAAGNVWTQIEGSGVINSLTAMSAKQMLVGVVGTTDSSLRLNQRSIATSAASSDSSPAIFRTSRWTGTAPADEDATLFARRTSNTVGGLRLETDRGLNAAGGVFDAGNRVHSASSPPLDVMLFRRCLNGVWEPLGNIVQGQIVQWLKNSATDPEPPEARVGDYIFRAS